MARYPIESGGSYAAIAAGTTNLQTSGDTSTCDFAEWHTHTQVINGMYQRKFVYDTTPVPGAAGVVSACPAISFTYIDCNYSVQVAEEKETASYCSGLYQPQQLIHYSDSTTGGLGLSGTFTTSATGYTRRKWVTTTDTEQKCMQTANCQIGKLPGAYDSSYDTSGELGSHIAELLMHCEQSCNIFNQNLVDY